MIYIVLCRVEYKIGEETVSNKLRTYLVGIQNGAVEDKMGWTVQVD